MTDLAVVVAAGPGVGAAVARRFAQAGFRLAVLSRRQAAMDALAAELGGGARGFAADAADPAWLEAALGRVVAEMGAPEILVYNANVWLEGKAKDLARLKLRPDLLRYAPDVAARFGLFAEAAGRLAADEAALDEGAAADAAPDVDEGLAA